MGKGLLDIQNPHRSHPAGLSSQTLAGPSLGRFHLCLGHVPDLNPRGLLAVPSLQSCFISPGLPKPKPSDFSQLMG